MLSHPSLTPLTVCGSVLEKAVLGVPQVRRVKIICPDHSGQLEITCNHPEAVGNSDRLFPAPDFCNLGVPKPGCFKPGCLQFYAPALFCALLRPFADLDLCSFAELHLRSFARFCAPLRVSASNGV